MINQPVGNHGGGGGGGGGGSFGVVRFDLQ